MEGGLCAEQDFQTNFCSNFPNHCGWHVEVHARPASVSHHRRASRCNAWAKRTAPAAAAAPSLPPFKSRRTANPAIRHTPFFCLRNESTALTTSELEVTSDSVVHMIAPGTVLKGRWRIARKIGQGDDFPRLDALYPCFQRCVFTYCGVCGETDKRDMRVTCFTACLCSRPHLPPPLSRRCLR